MAIPPLLQNTTVFAKTEATPFTAEADPPAATNALLLFQEQAPIVDDVQVTSIEALKGSMTPSDDIIGRRKAQVRLETLLMSSGLNTLVPFADPLFKACGLARASSTDANWQKYTYTPRSTGFEPCTVWGYGDGLRDKAYGCLGGMSLQFNAGDMPRLSFTLEGVSVDQAALSTPSATIPTDYKQLVESLGFKFTGGSQAEYGATQGLTGVSISLDWNLITKERRDFNSPKGFKGVIARRRESRLRVRLECEDVLTDKNFQSYITAQLALSDANRDDITWTHGLVASTFKIEFNITAPQLVKAVRVVDDGQWMWDLEYKLRHGTAEGEFNMIFYEDMT